MFQYQIPTTTTIINYESINVINMRKIHKLAAAREVHSLSKTLESTRDYNYNNRQSNVRLTISRNHDNKHNNAAGL